MGRLFLSAAHKSSGKTTVTLGLCAALTERGRIVQAFKKGPDYIDPMWHAAASRRPCRNLDFYTQTADEILATVRRHAQGADIALIEGNKGLYDGVDPAGGDSGAALAKLLRAPVVLVIDASGITRGVAPLILGYRAFDPEVAIAGVILNKVAGARHQAKLVEAVERYTDLPILGAVRRSSDLAISERHLGLIPANEAADAQAMIARVGRIIADSVDLNRLAALAGQAPALAVAPPSAPTGGAARTGRIGVARDAAFGFYYPEDLEALGNEGFELVFFDTLKDGGLPPGLDGLFIGGGFPETQMAALEANTAMRASVAAAVAAGLPTYAECGGLMYLSRAIHWDGRRAMMVGALPCETVMHPRPQGRGYVRMRETADFPWPGGAGPGGAGEGEPARHVVHAHEFHYAGVTNLDPGCRFAYAVERGAGIDGHHDGLVVANTLAAFTHLRGVGANPWPHRFADFIRASTFDRRCIHAA